jgi:aspartate/methionine/tyrosine aminotransferase
VLTSSTSEAYSLLFKLLGDPGDAVLAPRPSYPLVEHLTDLDGIVIEPYALEFHGRWSIDLEGIRHALEAPGAQNQGDRLDQSKQPHRICRNRR